MATARPKQAAATPSRCFIGSGLYPISCAQAIIGAAAKSAARGEWMIHGRIGVALCASVRKAAEKAHDPVSESCLSVAIITTVTLIAVPALTKTRDDYQLNSVANDVATKMQSARIRAISGNHDCRLSVTSTTSYAVECFDTLSWIAVEPIALPQGFTITENTPPVFHRLGSVVPTATIIRATVRDARRKSS